ncbi:SusC/RagA family TonB-linked outer membrane protein [Pedobacter psychroterrae]|uniref:SusC/RagA family TonB-linked outer membrane protein n=2 Tax=Pedobacter psychroterrae TaxID=2530453 RepID=A0A4R0NQ73_9SPHI|nr:SusC/RagA family TonB-linked outer membrane protein [Pedobacter psychroterrae]
MELTFIIKGLFCPPDSCCPQQRSETELIRNNHFAKKILRIMKITVALLFFFLLNSNAKSYSQTITYKGNNVTLNKLFDVIKKQTGFSFVVDQALLNYTTSVNLKVVNAPLKEVLDLALGKQGISYSILHNTIVVNVDEEKVGLQDVRSVLITGAVLDKEKNPIPGVSVRSKSNSALQTVTDKDGRFAIRLENADDILVFSYIGFETLEIELKGLLVLEVMLKEKASALDEVVISTGYQDIKRKDLPGEVQSLKVADILTPGINRLDQLLEGRVTGLTFMQNSGQVGAAPRLRIRGTSTILGNQEPLWVLDGIVLTDPVNVDPAQINNLDFVNLLSNSISGLNPDDIDQIDILKDASATAIYGARAANGVIVITTKRGKQGPPVFSYSAAGTFTQRPHYSDRSVFVMNSKDRVDVSREMIERKMVYQNLTIPTGYEAAVQDYYAGKIDYTEFQRLVSLYETTNTDWFDVITRDVLSTKHTLSISGGDPAVRYYGSLGYNNEQGTINGESLNGYTTNVGINANLKKFTLQFGLNANTGTSKYIPTEVGALNYAYNTSRAIPALNPDGSPYFYQRNNDYSMSYLYNVQEDMDNASKLTRFSTAMLTSKLGYQIYRDLGISATISYSTASTNEETSFTEKTFYIKKLTNDGLSASLAPLGGELREASTVKNSYTARLQSDYNKSFGSAGKHRIQASVGGELSSTKYDGFAITRRGYAQDRGKTFYSIPTTFGAYYNLINNTPQFMGIVNEQLTNILSVYAASTYSYDERYLISGSIRSDASNQFGQQANSRFQPIYAIAGRWSIKNDLLKELNWINDLALRASYGFQGNMIDNQTSQLVLQRSANNVIYNSLTSTVTNLPNPDLSREKTSSTNLGLDFSLFAGKLNGTLSYFYKKTTDAFLTKAVSEINGVNQYVVNQGDLTNQGFEVSLSFMPVNNSIGKDGKRGFSWRIDPQLGQVINKLITAAVSSKTNLVQNTINVSNLLNGNVQIAGKPLYTFYSFRYQGLSNADGSPIFYNTADSLKLSYNGQTPAEVYFQVLDESGTRIPILQGGISNSFGYRNFSLSTNFAYSLGNKVRLLKIASSYGTSNSGSTITPYPQQNLRQEFVDRWRKPGDENFTNIPGLKVNPVNVSPWWNGLPYSWATDVYEMYDNSDLRVVSGDYLKLQSASFRYNLENNLCKSLGLKSAYIGLSGTNLFTIAHKDLKGQDPAQSGQTPQINLSIRPTYSFNLNVTF